MNPKNNKVDCQSGQEDSEVNYDEKISIDATPQEVLDALFSQADNVESSDEEQS